MLFLIVLNGEENVYQKLYSLRLRFFPFSACLKVTTTMPLVVQLTNSSKQHCGNAKFYLLSCIIRFGVYDLTCMYVYYNRIQFL